MNTWKIKKLQLKKNCKLLFFAFIIHLIFCIIKYHLYGNNNDADFYWGDGRFNFEWLHFHKLPIGNSFVLYINYLFAKFLNVPKWFGFFTYSCISFIGYIYLYKLWRYFKIPLHQWSFGLFLCIPSIHFWNNGIGKEALIFPLSSILMYYIAIQKIRNFIPILSFALIALIRPHVGLILLLSYTFYFIIYRYQSLNLKYFLIFFSLTMLIFFVFNLVIFNQTLDFSRYILILDTHHEVLSQTNTYVPLENYNYPYKLFSFYFRPLPLEINNFMGWIYGLENLFFLIMSLISIYLYLSEKSTFPKLYAFILLLSLIYASIFVLAYSNFGLISRTKALVLPFIFILQFHIIFKFVTIHYNSNEKA